jgi:hypothetical protein
LQLQKSAAPRDGALGSQLLETPVPSGADLSQRARILQKAAAAAPNDRLVQTLWANLPVPVAHGRRHQQYPGHWMALARLEPDNGVAWIAVVDHAWKSGDMRAADAALARMAAAESYNEHLGEAVGAWRDVFHRYPPPQAQMLPGVGTASTRQDRSDLVFNEAALSSAPPIESLLDACRPWRNPHAGTKRFRTCGKIGRLMMRRSQTMLGRLVGVAILRSSHQGNASDIGMIRTVGWENEQYAKIMAAMAGNPYAKQGYLDLLQRTDSEMQAIQYELGVAGIALTPPAAWKQTVNGKPIEPLDDPSSQAH